MRSWEEKINNTLTLSQLKLMPECTSHSKTYNWDDDWVFVELNETNKIKNWISYTIFHNSNEIIEIHHNSLDSILEYLFDVFSAEKIILMWNENFQLFNWFGEKDCRSIPKWTDEVLMVYDINDIPKMYFSHHTIPVINNQLITKAHLISTQGFDFWLGIHIDKNIKMSQISQSWSGIQSFDLESYPIFVNEDCSILYFYKNFEIKHILEILNTINWKGNIDYYTEFIRPKKGNLPFQIRILNEPENHFIEVNTKKI